jgi:hypothetical protein
MLQSSIIKQRRRAGLLLVSWLLMTLFSCAALSNIDAGQEPANSQALSHHTMADMENGGHDDMPCCEQQLAPVCCDDVIALHSSYFNGADTVEKSELLSIASLPAAVYDYGPGRSIPASALATACQGSIPSYPRLHLVHCTFLD